MNEKDKVKPNKRWWRVLWITISMLFVIPLLICGGVFTWFFGRQADAFGQREERMEDLQKHGEPIDNASLQKLHFAQTSEQNTETWVALRKTLGSPEFGESSRSVPVLGHADLVVPTPGEAWEKRQDVDDFLAKWQAEIDRLTKISIAELRPDQKPVRRPIEFDSIATLLPDTQAIRQMGRLLKLRHAVAVFDQDSDVQMECLQAARGLERSTFGEPLIICQLLGMSAGQMTNDMIQLSVENDQLSDQQLSTVQQQLTDFATQRTQYSLAMRGERAAVLPVFLDPDRAEEAMELDEPNAAILMTKVRSIDVLYFLDQMESYLNVSESDPKEFRDEAQAAMQKLKSDVASSNVITKLDRTFSYLLIPAVGSYAMAIARYEEHTRLTRLAIQLRLYERKHDAWPESLVALADQAEDSKEVKPLGRESFGYKIMPNGEAMVWGVEQSELNPILTDPPELDADVNPRWTWSLQRGGDAN